MINYNEDTGKSLRRSVIPLPKKINKRRLEIVYREPMNTNGPIIIIEDDVDDQEMLIEVVGRLPYTNKLEFFLDGQSALDFLNLSVVNPFLILSDINIPKLDGFALRSKIRMDTDLQTKCIPYLLFSTACSQRMVIDDHSMSVQVFL